MRGLISANGKKQCASVTLVFDNSNDHQSPQNFKGEKEISVT